MSSNVCFRFKKQSKRDLVWIHGSVFQEDCMSILKQQIAAVNDKWQNGDVLAKPKPLIWAGLHLPPDICLSGLLLPLLYSTSSGYGVLGNWSTPPPPILVFVEPPLSDCLYERCLWMSDFTYSSCSDMHIHRCKMTLALRKQEKTSWKYTCSCNSGCLQLNVTIDGGGCVWKTVIITV